MIALALVALAAAMAAAFAVAGLGRHEAKAQHARPLSPPRSTRAVAQPQTQRKPAPLLTPAFRRHRLPIRAQAAIVVDARTGNAIWAKRAHARRRIASTTKIMTAVLALERLRLGQLVLVSPLVPRAAPIREGLRAGERVRAWKLLYGLMLYSGNDDALALAIGAAGSRPAFVKLMNAKARALGLRDSHFRSPSGVIDRDNYSSAWDMAALTRVALRNERFDRLVRTKIIHVPWSAPTYSKVYVNNNLMLRSYPGANGVKTGYTHKSGPCLVVSATRHGHTLIAVLLDDPNMYVDGTRLLNFGFSQT
jgi:D-alanyl-D-alanine carboxypeptidase